MLSLVQIVPRLPPDIDGIGDHALQLARSLKELFDLDTVFLVADPAWTGNTYVEGFRTFRLEKRSCADLEKLVMRIAAVLNIKPGRLAVLLHFAPYGYQKRGYPGWLVSGLRRLRSHSSTILISMFHELDAAGMGVTNSAFWLAPFQRHLIKELASLTAFGLTNCAYHRRRLLSWKVYGIPLLPSFSTIGEPHVNIPIADRKRQLVVFGRSSQRRKAYKEGLHALVEASRAFGTTHILDIGEPIKEPILLGSSGITIEYLGRQPALNVQQALQQSIASFIAYPEALLTKSSIYASSCACGTIPVIFSDDRAELRISELERERDFIGFTSSGSLEISSSLQDLSSSVFSQYQKRGSRAAASQIATFMWGTV